MMKKSRVWGWVASLGGVGYFPKAPGTAGTLVSLPLFWLLAHVSLFSYLLILVVIFALAILSADMAGKRWNCADDPRIVIDECVGIGIACAGLAPSSFLLFGVAFGVFRFFDIVKPWPASYFDKQCKNGFGVVIDDAVAGFYAWGFVALARFVLFR